MYVVNKIVGVMMSPSVLLMLICIGCAWRWGENGERVRMVRKTGLWLGLVLLWFWMSALPARILGLPLEREWLVDGQIPTAESFPKADAIVCLGGSMNIATNLGDHAEMYTSADRVWQAARLYKAGKAPKIFVTGRGTARAAQRLLMDCGVPESVITLLEDARNTEEEAKGIVRLFDCSDCSIGKSRDEGIEQSTNLNNRTILLVTSSWHMRRAKLMFEKYAKGVEVIPAPADFEATVHAAEEFNPRDLLPGNSYMNEVYLREWIGYFGYEFLR